MQYNEDMIRAPRFPSRWAGLSRTLGLAAALSAALGACAMFGPPGGTMEYPGSGAGPNAVAVYVVNQGDTVESISQRYGVATQTIIDRNKLKSPYRLKEGQYIELPGARFVADNTRGAATQTASASAPGPVQRETLAPPPGSAAAKGEPPASAAPARETAARETAGQPTPLSPAAQESKTATAAAPRFIWPLSGKVLTPYGTAAGGQKNDGIDIQATVGEPVKAADGGTVIYAGSDVAHLGNLLLVQHAGGYITAYGNNEALLVKKGAKVRKGQVIAKAGNSGGVPSPRLHFEVRRGGSKTVDPLTVLPRQ